MTDQPARWRKSSHSGGGNNCVEVHGNLGAVRDSKNPAGPVLTGDLVPLLGAVKAHRIG